MSDDEDDRDHRGRRRPDLDPEALADMRYRAESERMTDRTRLMKPAVGSGYPPVFVTSWKCRHPKCEALVDVTQDTVDTLAVFNAELVRRGEREIPTNAIVLCDEHRDLAAYYRVEAVKKRHVRLRDAIQQLKASDSPRSEHALIEECRACHHPDVDGLLQSLTDKLGKKPRGKPL